MSSAGTGIDNPNLVPYRRYLEQAVQQVNVTLNSLKLNHPSITQQDMDKIKRYISESLEAQAYLDEQKCIEEKKPNPYTIKSGGVSRKVMEFVTSERHAIGIYKRCVYDIEGMDSAVQKLKDMPHESKLNHKKLQLLNSYTKHYDRFQKDLGMLLKFDNVEGKLKEEFERSHDTVGRREWKQNLSKWKRSDYPVKPDTYQSDYNIHFD